MARSAHTDAVVIPHYTRYNLSFCNGTRRFGIRNVCVRTLLDADAHVKLYIAHPSSHMGTTTGFEPHLVAPGGHAAYQTSQRLRPAASNDTLSTRRLNLAAAIQRVQVTQRLTSQHASSSLQAKGKVQRNHHVAGSALHLDGGRDSASAAYASAAYAQSRASNEHDADMVAFSDAAMGRLSGIRATINMNRRRGCVHAQYAPGEADTSQARGTGGKAEAASIYAVLDELLELTAAKDASLLEAGLRRHASIIRTCRGAVGETVP